jgi:hypothetical protein
VGQNNTGISVGADSITIESIAIAFFSLAFTLLSSDWEYFWIFYLALGGVLLLMLFRVMAGKADDPNNRAIKHSLILSSTLLQVALLGVLSACSLFLSTYLSVFSAVVWFVILGISLPISVALADVLWLEEYTETWVDIVYQQTNDDLVGQIIRAAIDFGKERIDAFKKGNETITPQITLRAVFLGVALLVLITLVTIPIWIVVTGLLRDWILAVFMIVSLLLLRDLIRYIYIRYGPAGSLEDLKLRLRYGFTVLALKSVLVLSALGYDLWSILRDSTRFLL